MKHLLVALLLAALLAMVSCGSDNPVKSASGGSFRLIISISDDQNNPQANLRISAWNLLEGLHVSNALLSNRPTVKPLFTTAIRFDLPVACKTQLIAYNMRHEVVQTIVDSELEAGRVDVMWGNVPTMTGGVYTLELRCTDTTTHALLHQDSVFAVLWSSDPDINVLGYTNDNGIFETNDNTRFPNTLGLPEMVQTDESGNLNGTFTISDTITIVVTDTVTHIQQEYCNVIGENRNNISLLWSPPPSKLASTIISHSRKLSTINIDRIKPIPSEFRLYQNYPNPFN